MSNVNGIEHLSCRLRQRFPCVVGPAPITDRATLALDVADQHWRISVADGVARLDSGAVRNAACTVGTDAATLGDLLAGRRTIVEAFLDGDLRTRGSLTTALHVGAALAPPSDRSSQLASRTVSAAGVRTAYLEAGPRDAPQVVLIHGLGATSAAMLPLLADLSADHRVLAPDIPGFGASQAPRWTYTAGRLCAWLCSFLAATDTHRPIVIGNSLGGRLAIELAIHDAGAVRDLVLLCPSPAFRRFRQLAPVAKRWPVELIRLPSPRLPRALVLVGLRSLFAHPERIPRHWFETAADEFDTAMGHGLRRRAALSALLNIYIEEPFGTSGFWNRLQGVRTPTLFLWGACDRLVPARFARHVTDAIPTARSVVLPDCGHAPQLEHPDLTLRLIRRFLDTPHRLPVAGPTHQPAAAVDDPAAALAG